jgi:hypothetical protein
MAVEYIDDLNNTRIRKIKTLSFMVSDETINMLDEIRKKKGFVTFSEIIRFCISNTYENIKEKGI